MEQLKRLDGINKANYTTSKDLMKVRLKLTYNDSPMNSIGVKFVDVEGKIQISILPLTQVGTNMVLCKADEIPPALYKLGSIIVTRFQSWVSSSSDPISSITRDIRDCTMEVFFVGTGELLP